MADAVVNVILKARDEASAEVGRLGRQLGDMPASLGRIASAAGSFGIIAGVAASAGAAVLAMTRSFGDQAEELDRISRGVGSTVKEVDTMRMTYKALGLDIGQADTALQFMSRAISLHHDRLAALGVTSRDAVQAILQLTDVTAKHGDAAKRNAEFSQLLGRQWRTLAAVAPDLRDKYNEMSDALEKNGGWTDEMIAKGKVLHDQWAQLGVKFRGFWLNLASDSASGSSSFLTMLDNITTAIEKFEDKIKKSKFNVTWGDLWNKVKDLEGKVGFGNFPPTRTGSGTGVWEKTLEGMKAEQEYFAQLGEDIDDDDSKLMKHLALVKEVLEVFPEFSQKQAESFAFQIEDSQLAQKREQWMKEMVQGPTEKEAKEAAKQAKEMWKKVWEGMVEEQKFLGAPNMFESIIEGWKGVVDQQLDMGNILQEGLGHVYQSLDIAVQQVFTNIFKRGQTLSGALKIVFASIGQAFLDVISHIVATEMFKLFLKLIGMVVFGPLGGGGDLLSGVGGGGPALARGGLAPGNTTTININAIAPNAVLSEVLDPSGSFRRTNMRIGELGAM